MSPNRLAWAVGNLMYIALYMASGTLAGDMYVNFFLSAVVEIPAYIAAFVLMEKFGKRPSVV